MFSKIKPNPWTTQATTSRLLATFKNTIVALLTATLSVLIFATSTQAFEMRFQTARALFAVSSNEAEIPSGDYPNFLIYPVPHNGFVSLTAHATNLGQNNNRAWISFACNQGFTELILNNSSAYSQPDGNTLQECGYINVVEQSRIINAQRFSQATLMELVVDGTVPDTCDIIRFTMRLESDTPNSAPTATAFAEVIGNEDCAGPVQFPDLSIRKSVDNETPNIDDTVTFTLIATNSGVNANFTSVSVNDLLPTGLSYVSHGPRPGFPFRGDYDHTTGIWDIGDLNPGELLVLEITATVQSTGSYRNTAEIRGAEAETNLANNTATVTLRPLGLETDLAIAKTVNTDAPAIGDNVTFTLTANNLGPSDATEVEVTDLLPDGYSYVSHTTLSGTYDQTNGIWTIGDLTNGQDASLEITAEVLSSGTYTNTATISGRESDPELSNNTATVQLVPEVAFADLAILKTASSDSPTVGQTITFTLTASNLGPSDATEVNVTDLLPAGYSYIAHTPQDAIYDSETGVWEIGDLQFEEVVTLQIMAEVLETGPYDNTAIIAARQSDPDLTNNEATVGISPVTRREIIDATERAIASFMLGRANNLASNQPRLIRFLRGGRCAPTMPAPYIEKEPTFEKVGGKGKGSQSYLEEPEVIRFGEEGQRPPAKNLPHSFNVNVTDDFGMLNGCIAQGNLWSEVTAAWGNGSSYTLGTIGAHHFMTPDLILGGMVQFDRATDDRNNARGTGWMVGPYFAAKLPDQPLYFEGRLLYGQTDNRISPLGTYTDSFKTERWLAQLRAEGEIVQETITWIPLLDLTHTEDRSRGYTDTLGNAIGSQSVALTQATAGLDFRLPLQSDGGSLELIGGASAIYSATTGGSADFENGRGRVHMGMNWNSGRGATVRAGAFYDGIGSRFRSAGGNLGLDIRF